MKRAAKFLFYVLLSIVFLASVILGLYFLNEVFHFIKNPVKDLNIQIKHLNALLFSNMLAGISVGSILLVFTVFIIPVLMKNVDSKQYLKSMTLGLVASLVFFITQTIYDYFLKFGRIYMVIALIVVVVITIIIVQILSLLFKSKRAENTFRTEIMANIASGLVFGVLLNIIFIVIEIVKNKV